MNVLSNINLNENEIQNVKFHILGTDPLIGTLTEARFWYNSTSKKIKYFDGTAVQTLADLSALTGLLEYKGTINASTNPNYPSGSVGDTYIFSASGKIGGASGEEVEAGDMLICNADNAGGTEASVGANWDVIQKNLPSNIAKKYSVNGISVGSVAGVVTITHNLNTLAVVTSVFLESTGEQLFLDVKHASVNTITIEATGSAKIVTVTVIG
jgi:hypothetical protein